MFVTDYALPTSFLRNVSRLQCDQKARDRVFRSGDKVLVLLPVHGSPLQAHYCGPFTIEEKVISVDYVISTPGHHKAKQLCHVNMLKAYNEKHEVQCIPKPVSVVSLNDG